MVDELHVLLDARKGHFSLESGLHGNLWLDLDTPFSQPQQLQPLAARLADLLMPYRPVVVCGPLVGGALLAQLVAVSANMRLTYAERVALVPGTLWSARYELVRPFRNLVHGQRVVVVDDVVNAGSALRSTVAAVREAGGDAWQRALSCAWATSCCPISRSMPCPCTRSRSNLPARGPPTSVRCASKDSRWTPDKALAASALGALTGAGLRFTA